jgi:hypothetical protein
VFGYRVNDMSSVMEHGQFSEHSGYWEAALKIMDLCLQFFKELIIF